jgi:hypothetical protein
MKPRFFSPRLVLAGIGAVKEQVNNLRQTSDPKVKAIVEKHPKSLAILSMLLDYGENLARRAVAERNTIAVIEENGASHDK